jgi:hypothetical protein
MNANAVRGGGQVLQAGFAKTFLACPPWSFRGATTTSLYGFVSNGGLYCGHALGKNGAKPAANVLKPPNALNGYLACSNLFCRFGR